MSENEWKGEERRGLPIHVLNYIDERMREFDGKLNGLQDQLHEISMSISSWMEKHNEVCKVCQSKVLEDCEKMVDEAIPTHPDNADATPREKRKEHRKAHASWIRKVDDEMGEWKRIRQRVREWAVIGGISMAGLAIWEYILSGPK